MKAFNLDRYGKKQALRLGDRPEPVPGPGDVLVEVEAAGLNPLDSKIRDGAFKPILPYKPPIVLGHDLAGTRAFQKFLGEVFGRFRSLGARGAIGRGGRRGHLRHGRAHRHRRDRGLADGQPQNG